MHPLADRISSSLRSVQTSAITFSRFDMQLFKMDHIYIYINIVIRPEVVAWSRTATAAVPTETFSRGPTFTATDDGTAVLLAASFVPGPLTLLLLRPWLVVLVILFFFEVTQHMQWFSVLLTPPSWPEASHPRQITPKGGQGCLMYSPVWNLSDVIWFPYLLSCFSA